MTAKPRMLITGVSGLLGANLAKHFAPRYDVLGTYFSNAPMLADVELLRVNLTEQAKAWPAPLADFAADVVIHCAGEANVDRCEQDPDHAQRHIVAMTKLVAGYAQRQGAYLVSISTDAVGDGQSPHLREDDATAPINVYGAAKVSMEQYLLREHPQALIVRTRFYGLNVTGKKCFAEYLIDELAAGRRVRCFDDNYCSQLYVMHLATILEQAIDERLAGIYHIVGDERQSRFEFATAVAKVFDLDAGLIERATQSVSHSHAPRPADTSLSNARIKARLACTMASTVEGLGAMKRDRQA